MNLAFPRGDSTVTWDYAQRGDLVVYSFFHYGVVINPSTKWVESRWGVKGPAYQHHADDSPYGVPLYIEPSSTATPSQASASTPAGRRDELSMLYEIWPHHRPTAEEQAVLDAQEAESKRQAVIERRLHKHKRERDLDWRRPGFSLPKVPMRRSRGAALPAFVTFREDYCQGRRPDPTTAWVRTGNPNAFSEFTLGLTGPHKGRQFSAQMMSDRGSGSLTGQYSLGAWSNRDRWDDYEINRVKREGPATFGLVPAPRRPFVVPYRSALKFDNAVKAIHLVAEQEDPAAHLQDIHAWAVTSFHRNARALVLDAIAAWRRTQIVHPVNIVLSRLGYDGLTYADPKAASSFRTGSVRFPPINRYGLPVGMWIFSNKYMVPDCSSLPFTPIPAWT